MLTRMFRSKMTCEDRGDILSYLWINFVRFFARTSWDAFAFDADLEVESGKDGGGYELSYDPLLLFLLFRTGYAGADELPDAVP